MAHPFRQEVAKSQNAKVSKVANPYDAAVCGDAPEWNEYGASKSQIGNKYGNLGPNAPATDSANISRPINRDPKAYRG